MAGTCECGNAPSGYIECGEFRDWLRTGRLVRKDSAPWSELPVEVVSLFVKHFFFERFCNGIANRDY